MKLSFRQFYKSGSFKRQIVVVFTAGFFILGSGFAVYMAKSETAFLYRIGNEDAASLADSLAASSLPWVMANDLAGLREIMAAFKNHPGLHYAMIVSPAGRVIAHTDEARTGQFVTDQASLEMLKSAPGRKMLVDNDLFVDVAVPVMAQGRHIGWVRVEQGREEARANLRNMMAGIIVLVLLATAMSFLAAAVIANRLGARIGLLERVAREVRAGNFNVRVSGLEGNDEFARLGGGFNQMLDALEHNISGLRAAEQEVRRLATRNRLILESAGDGIYGLDSEGRCTFINPSALKLFGFSAAEFIGQSSHALIHHTRADGSPYPQEECPVQATSKQGKVRYGEDLYWRKDGSSFPVDFISTPIVEEGVTTGTVVMFRDITERKQAEQSIFEAQQVFRSLVENSPDIITRYDRDCKRTYVNPAYLKETQLNKGELIGQTPVQRSPLPSSGAAALQKLLRKVLDGGAADSIDVVWPKDDGLEHWYNIYAFPEYDRDGNVVSVMTISRDITARKRAEAELRELNNDFVTLLENTSDFIYFKDKDSRIVFCSQTLASITGHASWHDMVGKHDLEIFPPDTARVYYEEELPIFREGRPLLNKTDPYYDEQGRKGWVNTNKWPVFGEDGKTVIGIFGISRDITELKEAENKIGELNRDLERRVAERTAQLEAANKELEAFSYSVSHDLRTPLRAIDGFSRIMLDEYGGQLDDEGRRLLRIVRENAIRMAQLIDDILQFSRTGRLEIAYSGVNMAGLAHEVAQELQETAPNPKLEIRIGELPQVNGDRTMLRQVFVNLLANAIKFSRARELPVVEVTAERNADEIIYAVRDNGAGFDMRYMDKLFGVFQRLHTVEEFEGTGIGLAIVKRIVTRHGGRVWAEGKVGEGATIYFALPAMVATL